MLCATTALFEPMPHAAARHKLVCIATLARARQRNCTSRPAHEQRQLLTEPAATQHRTLHCSP
eukprot:4989747-Alexandrium_andersonii.AAC.1